MMHEHGIQPVMMQQKDAVMMEMWENLTGDLKKTLMKRMIDAKKKEGIIKHIPSKIETMKMIKTVPDE